jgi:hypothetical protein
MMHTEHSRPGGWIRSRARLALLAFLGIAAFFLWTEHRAHLFGVLPYLLLLLCPVLHMFMHRGHGSGHAGHGANRTADEEGDR